MANPQVDTPAFKAWFKQSKVVDDSGQPLIVYHGTNSDFSSFDPAKTGAASDHGFAGKAFYFMDDPEWASGYAEISTGDHGGQQTVYPVYLSLQNPKIQHDYDESDPYDGGTPGALTGERAAAMQQKLIDAGYDGVITLGKPGNPSEYAAFYPHQIKSATGNAGTFSPDSSDLTEQVASDIDAAIAETEEQETTPEFRTWFGASKAVDATGAPQVYYHGTLADFDEFKSRDGAFYFSADPKTATGAERGFLDPDDFKDLGLPPEAFAAPDGLQVLPCYLRVLNPASEADVERLAPGAANIRAAVPELRAAGFDGFMNGYETIVFNSTSIKSATANSGAFNPISSNIMETTVTAYHGTRNGGFDDFKANYRKGEQLGFGIHFAADRDFAARYANDDLVARKGKAPMVYTVQLTMDRPLKADTIVRDGTPEFALAKQLAGSKLYVSKDEDGTPCCYMQNAIDATGGQRAEKLIRAAGFDSVIYHAKVGSRVMGGMQVSGKSESYIVFEPSQIKVVSKESLTEGADEDELAALQAEYDVAKAELKANNTGTNFRRCGQLHQQIEDLTDRIKQNPAPGAAPAADDYHGTHRPPGPEDGAPASDMTANGVYPADFYGPRGALEYGQGDAALARRVQALKGQPDALVWIYRALPPGVPTTTHTAFRPGDWVTISKDYAQEHGDSNLDAGFKIARKRCRASEIFTNGDSLDEWGYWPQARTESKAQEQTPEFKAWFGNSIAVTADGSPRVFYHGTGSDFDAFEPDAKGLIFVSPSADVAARYASELRSGGNQHVMPVYVRVTKTFDFRKKDQLRALAGVLDFDALRQSDPGEGNTESFEDESDDSLLYMISLGNYNVLEAEATLDAIRQLGYDSMITDELGVKALAVFSPNQLKSATGNSGAFGSDTDSVTEAAADVDATVTDLKQTDTPEFAAWFKQSKVVDDAGAPLRVYHGTSTWETDDGRHMGDIKTFDRLWATVALRRAHGLDTIGSWFSDNPGEGGAAMYTGNVMYAVYLSIQKPWTVTFDGMKRVGNRLLGRDREAKVDRECVDRIHQWMEECGYDGICVQHDEGSGSTEFAKQNAWIALKPEQIKSATGNSGAFDPASSDITESGGIEGMRKAWQEMGLECWVGQSDRTKTLDLSQIVIPKGDRGKGLGTQFMQSLCAYADSIGYKITLSPSTDFGGSSVSRLREFYKRFGFVDNKGRNKDYTIRDAMYRLPAAFEAARADVAARVRQLTR